MMKVHAWQQGETKVLTISNPPPPPKKEKNWKEQALIIKLSAPIVTMSAYTHRGHDEPEVIVTGTLLNSLNPSLHTNPHHTAPVPGRRSTLMHTYGLKPMSAFCVREGWTLTLQT